MKLKGGSSQFKKERKELYAEVAKIYSKSVYLLSVKL